MNKKLLLVIAIICILPSASIGQRWKYQRYEFSFGVGMSNFLGELGGANQVGTHYFRDYEFSETKFAAAIALRYKLSSYFALKTHLSYGRVSGDDKLTEEYYRNYRNLNFFADIYEFNINFEGAFQEEQIGHRYRIRRVKGLKSYELYMYAFGGIGFFYFNPKTIDDHGNIQELHPLKTEGQGIVADRSNYSLIQPCIPLGVGFKYTIDRKWGIGLELGLRKTFTDYIDDVSTTYYDVKQYADQLSDPSLTATLSDRSDKSNPSVTGYPNYPEPNQQRGDPRYKDSYIFGIFSINYKMRNGRNNLPLF